MGILGKLVGILGILVGVLHVTVLGILVGMFGIFSEYAWNIMTVLVAILTQCK